MASLRAGSTGVVACVGCQVIARSAFQAGSVGGTGDTSKNEACTRLTQIGSCYEISQCAVKTGCGGALSTEFLNIIAGLTGMVG